MSKKKKPVSIIIITINGFIAFFIMCLFSQAIRHFSSIGEINGLIYFFIFILSWLVLMNMITSPKKKDPKTKPITKEKKRQIQDSNKYSSIAFLGIFILIIGLILPDSFWALFQGGIGFSPMIFFWAFLLFLIIRSVKLKPRKKVTKESLAEMNYNRVQKVVSEELRQHPNWKLEERYREVQRGKRQPNTPDEQPYKGMNDLTFERWMIELWSDDKENYSFRKSINRWVSRSSQREYYTRQTKSNGSLWDWMVHTPVDNSADNPYYKEK